jgi:hypothetical protein
LQWHPERRVSLLIHRHEESAVRYVIEPPLAMLSRFTAKSLRTHRMRKPSPLPTVVPTNSSYLQRLLGLLGAH